MQSLLFACNFLKCDAIILYRNTEMIRSKYKLQSGVEYVRLHFSELYLFEQIPVFSGFLHDFGVIHRDVKASVDRNYHYILILGICLYSSILHNLIGLMINIVVLFLFDEYQTI